MSDKNHSFLKSYIKGESLIGFWSVIVKLISAAIAFIVISNLDVFKYGVYILILSGYSFLASLFLKPLQGVIFNDISRFYSEDGKGKAKKLYLEMFKLRIFTGIILSLILFFTANIVASFYDNDIATLIRILSPLFLIDAFYGSMKTFFKVHLRFDLIVFRPIVYKSLKLGIILYFLYFASFGIQEVILAHTIASFVAMLVFIPSFLKLYNPWKNIIVVKEAVLWQIAKTYGKWPLFSQILSRSVKDVRPWIIKFFVNTEAVAIFSVAESFYGGLKGFFPSTTLTALIPRHISNRKQSEKILIKGTKYLFFITILLAIAGFFIVPFVIKIIFPQYIDSILLFKILLPALFILSFKSIGTTFLVALRKQKYLFYVGIAQVTLGLLFPLILLNYFGIIGMALERVITALIIGILIYGYILKNEIHISFFKTFFTYDNNDKIFFQKLFIGLSRYIKSFFIKNKKI